MEYENLEWYEKISASEFAIAVLCFIISAGILVSMIAKSNKREFDNGDYNKYVSVAISTDSISLGGQSKEYTVTVENLRNKRIEVVITLEIRHQGFSVQDGLTDDITYRDITVVVEPNDSESVSGTEPARGAQDCPFVFIHNIKGTVID